VVIRHAIGLNIGRVLSRSFSIWLGNFVPFTVIALVVQSPLLLFAIFAPLETTWQSYVYIGTVTLAPYVFSLVIAGAVAFGVFQQLRGERASFGQVVSVGLKRLGRVTGVAVSVGLLIGLVIAIAAWFAFAVWIPLFILAIPAIAIACAFWVAVPSAVVEGTGVIRSIRRSAFLTKEARIPIFGILLLLGLIAGGVGFGVGIAAKAAQPRETAVYPRFDPGLDSDEALAKWERDREIWQVARWKNRMSVLRTETVFALIARAILACLNAVASVIVYYDLRSQKELVHLAEIAKVFD
jgi:hypothetical protein